ncbi:MAG: hypothetical protein RIG84_01415 [Roseovarius sp.]
MTRTLRTISLAIALTLATAAGAQAACMVEYKAKRDKPFELFYNVTQIAGPCTQGNAQAQVSAMLASRGLTLLKILSVKDQ